MNESQPTPRPPTNNPFPSLDYFAAPSPDSTYVQPVSVNGVSQPLFAPYSSGVSSQPYPPLAPGQWPQFSSPAYAPSFGVPVVPPVISADGYAAPGQPLPYFSPYGYPGLNYPFSAPTDVKSAPKASFWQRLGALALDTVITYGIVTAFDTVWLIATAVILSKHYSAQNWAIVIGELILIIGLAAFDTILIGRKGLTIGSMAVKIRYVNAKGEKPGCWRAFFRWLLLTIFFTLFCVGSIVLFEWSIFAFNPYNYYTPISPIWVVLSFGAVSFFLIGRLWFLWDSNRQTLFDRIVGIYALNARYYRY